MNDLDMVQAAGYGVAPKIWVDRRQDIIGFVAREICERPFFISDEVLEWAQKKAKGTQNLETSGMDVEEKIEAILLWAEDNPDFDASYVESLDIWLDDHDGLTEAQEQGLDNIIVKWRIPL